MAFMMVCMRGMVFSPACCAVQQMKVMLLALTQAAIADIQRRAWSAFMRPIQSAMSSKTT